MAVNEAHIYFPANTAVPPLYATEKIPDPLVHIKLFTPDSGWSWFITEYDPVQKLAFGYVVGLEAELGYISIAEIEEVRGPLGLRIERDLNFKPTPLSEVMGVSRGD